ncbi:MAG: protein-glutamate methylesterase CheB, partial [Planctomycetaceae bacterium]|nr:protein-glutamate methylesterase CheB [Planctomycetaceae bacterium]
MKPIRVLIVEGASTTRQTLSRVLGQDAELEVVAATATGRLALAKLSDLGPDVVLLYISRPDKEGLKTHTSIRETR